MNGDFARGRSWRVANRDLSGGVPTVAVVVNTYNQATFLADALDSIFAQSRQPDEVIIIDDGSTDDAWGIAQRYRDADYVRQDNAGLAAARNTGLLRAKSQFIVFLDADDRLLPHALEQGLTTFGEMPDCAFVYGGHRVVDVKFRPTGSDRFDPVGEDPYCDFLRFNPIGMHATVMYRRNLLVQAGGFSADLSACEDYDVYLRLSRAYPIGSHPQIVAEYRIHGLNMSRDSRAMLSAVLVVLDRQKAVAAETAKTAAAWRDGRRIWRDHYGNEVIAAAADTHRNAPLLMKAIAMIAAGWRTPRLLAQLSVISLRRRIGMRRGFKPPALDACTLVILIPPGR